MEVKLANIPKYKKAFFFS